MQEPTDQEFNDGTTLYGKILNNLISNCIKNLPYTTILERDDIYQIALHTLWNCMKKFDISRGAKFSTYLYFCLNRKLWKISKKEWKRYNANKKWEENRNA